MKMKRREEKKGTLSGFHLRGIFLPVWRRGKDRRVLEITLPPGYRMSQTLSYNKKVILWSETDATKVPVRPT